MITCGTDLSRGSDAALRLAVAWARRQGEAVRAVHVLEGPAEALAGGASEPVIARELEARLALAMSGGEVAGSCELVPGEAVAVLRSQTGTLVVGTEGSSATLLRRTGHVPQALAAGLAPGARLLIAPLGWTSALTRRRRSTGPRRASVPLGERILVACSLNGGDAERLALAARLASASPSAEIHLAHVIDVSCAREHPASARAAVKEITDEARTRAEESLRRLSADAPDDLAMSVTTRFHVVRQGPIERDLAGLAGSQSIDLLIAGPGTIAARLTGFARCPVLIG